MPVGKATTEGTLRSKANPLDSRPKVLIVWDSSPNQTRMRGLMNHGGRDGRNRSFGGNHVLVVQHAQVDFGLILPPRTWQPRDEDTPYPTLHAAKPGRIVSANQLDRCGNPLQSDGPLCLLGERRHEDSLHFTPTSEPHQHSLKESSPPSGSCRPMAVIATHPCDTYTGTAIRLDRRNAPRVRILPGDRVRSEQTVRAKHADHHWFLWGCP